MRDRGICHQLLAPDRRGLESRLAAAPLAEWASIWPAMFLLVAAQGVLLAFAVATVRSSNRHAQWTLATLLLAFSLFLFEGFVDAASLYPNLPHTYRIADALPFLTGPLLFLFLRAITQPLQAWRKLDGLHFLPFMACVLFLTPLYAMSGPEKLALLEARRALPIPLDVLALAALKIAHGFLYLVLILRLSAKVLSSTGHHVDPLRAALVGRVRLWIVLFYAAQLLPLGLFLLIALDIGTPPDSDLVLSVMLALGLHAGAFSVIRSRQILSGTSSAEPSKAVDQVLRPRYATSALSPSDLDRLVDRLERIMHDREPFRRPNLALAELATEVGVSANQLSQVLNEGVGRNFYEYVNRFRVEALERSLADPANAHRTVLALAEHAGFNSKASANRIFKLQTGRTPSQARRAPEA